MDGNLWSGDKIVKGDPNYQKRNGKMFEDFLHKNPNLNVTNALPKCEGKWKGKHTNPFGMFS